MTIPPFNQEELGREKEFQFLLNIVLQPRKPQNIAAIVGPPASGKTTLVYLLAKVIEASYENEFPGGVVSIRTRELRPDQVSDLSKNWVRRSRFLLVLDDIDEIQSSNSPRILRQIIDEIPEDTSMLITSRSQDALENLIPPRQILKLDFPSSNQSWLLQTLISRLTPNLEQAAIELASYIERTNENIFGRPSAERVLAGFDKPQGLIDELLQIGILREVSPGQLLQFSHQLLFEYFSDLATHKSDIRQVSSSPAAQPSQQPSSVQLPIQPDTTTQPPDISSTTAQPDQQTSRQVPVQLDTTIQPPDTIQVPTEPSRILRPERFPNAVNDRTTKQDALGYENYALAFTELIQHADPPLTIGIYGAWGTGKTFLLDLIRQGIVNYKPSKRKTPFKPSSKNIPVTFDAWTYNASDQLWVGLLERVFAAIRNQIGPLRWLWLTLHRNLNREWLHVQHKVIPYTLVASVVGAVFIVGLRSVKQNDLVQLLAFLIQVLGVPALITIMATSLVRIFQASQSDKIAELFVTDHYQQYRSVIANIREDLKTMLERLPKHTKLVIFIDDLDRCRAERAVEVLEAVHLLLDFEQVIVFLAVDTRILSAMVEESFQGVLARSSISGYEYLDKVVQIPFGLPYPNDLFLTRYINILTGANFRSTDEIEPTAQVSLPPLPLKDEDSENPENLPVTPKQELPLPRPTERADEVEVSFTPLEQQAFRTFSKYGSRNPRRLKRQVNIYRLVRTLMMQVDEFRDEEADSLILWLALCDSWPYTMSSLIRMLTEPDKSDLDVAALFGLLISQSQPDMLDTKSDLNYPVVENLLSLYGHLLTREHILKFARYTINFYPLMYSETLIPVSPSSHD